MDQADVTEMVDVGPGLSDTVAVLNGKAREESVAVTLGLEDKLPKVRGFAGELNQVWGHLIENALDAVPSQGRVDVVASREDHKILVRIFDDGPRISDEN